MLVNIDQDEWYPVLFLNVRVDDEFDEYYTYIDVPDEIVKEYQKSFQAFCDAQVSLRKYFTKQVELENEKRTQDNG